MARKIIASPADPGDATHYGTDDTGYINKLLTGVDQSGTDPVTMATNWTFNNQKAILRNPANTFSSTIINPAITTNSNFQFNTVPDYYIFIDPDDGNKIKARNGRTGAIDSVHATNADVVINAAITNLSAGSTIGAFATPTTNLWTGGQYGTIFLGPGIFTIYSSIALQSNIALLGSGQFMTQIKLADNRPNDANSTVIKSSTWDTHSYQAGSLTNAQRQQADVGIIIKDMDIFGNRNNQSLVVQTNPNTITGGGASMQQSWGHGVAIYGNAGMIIENVSIHHCLGAGFIVQAVATNLGTGSFITGNQGPLGECVMKNMAVGANGYQGYLIRAPVEANNLWSWYNGEAGLEIQDCAFFGGTGPSRFIMCWFFLDGQNYTQGQYNATGYEVMLQGGNMLYDSWVEGPKAGDSLVIGRPAGTPTSSTDYTLKNEQLGADIRGMKGDFPKYSAILLNTGGHTIQAGINGPSSTVFAGGQYGTTCVNSTGCTDLIGGNYLDLDLHDFDQTTENGITMGSVGTSIGFDKIYLKSARNMNPINWVNAGNVYNAIFAQMTVGGAGGQNHFTIVGAGLPIDKSNKIILQNGGYSNKNFLGYNYGKTLFNGGGTTFTIPHGIWTTPSYCTVAPANAASAPATGSIFWTADATNINVTYPANTGAGTNNISLWWRAEA